MDAPPIIVLPGIMGSRLYRSQNLANFNRIWEPDLTFPEAKRSQASQASKTQPKRAEEALMGISDLFVRNLGVYLQYPNPLQVPPPSSTEYGAGNTYRNLMVALVRSFPDRDVYFFSYDFRDSNLKSAQKLQEFITQLGVSQVDLVCHSMGGLVAALLRLRRADRAPSVPGSEKHPASTSELPPAQLRRADRAPSVSDPEKHPASTSELPTAQLRRIITLGTPFLGAPELLKRLLKNELLKTVSRPRKHPQNDTKTPNASHTGTVQNLKSELGDVYLTLSGLTGRVAESFPSTAQLLPFPEYAAFGAIQFTTQQPVQEHAYREFFQKLFGRNIYAEAIKFQEKLLSPTTHLPFFEGETDYYCGYSSHTHSETTRSVILKKNLKGRIELQSSASDFDGDSTVPTASATVMGLLPKALESRHIRDFRSYTHEELAGVNPHKPEVLAWIIEILRKN